MNGRQLSVTGWRDWAGATLAAAVGATALDALLLQLRRSYFTGGFLAQDSATSAGQVIAFFAGSLLSDAAVAGVLALIGLWIATRVGLSRVAAVICAAIVALAPLALADAAEYQLLTMLGDRFDLALLFDLSGRNPAEFVAVAAGHLVDVTWIGALTVALLAVAWTVARRRRRARGERIGGAATSGRTMMAAIVLLLAGAVGTTAFRSSSDALDNGLRRKPSGQVLGLAVERLTDVDRDGYGILGRPDDPDLFDARIRPYALDVPGDGIDEDGVGGDLPAGVEPYREGPSADGPWRARRDVVLIVLESVRADAVGARVDGMPVTPVLDELAAHGISSQHAYSHNGYTVQSRHHIFSGSTADVRGGETLIDDFKAHGYETAYFSAQDESFGGAEQGVGFERADVSYDARVDRDRRFTSFTTAGSLAVPATVVEERIQAFLAARHSDKPLFLFVNFQDTHFPYHHDGLQPLIPSRVLPERAIVPANQPQVRRMYLNAVANVDRAIGNVLASTRQALGREPGVIVLSDHGESLFDEGFLGHGYALNDAQTRIPLVAANLPLRIEEPFGESDLRDALWAALRQPEDAPAVPLLVPKSDKQVFQYLGLVRRPAQIGFVSLDGSRVLYDFRDALARLGNEWQRPDALTGERRDAFLRLIRTWERMRLARDGATAEDQ